MTHTRTKIARVVIAGEHPIFREGLRRLIETQPAFVAVATGDESSAVALVSEFEPDVLVLVLGPEGRSVVETIQQLAATVPLVRTIVLTNSVDRPDVVRALELGARGIVPKDSQPDVLFKSLECVMAGRYWVGGEHAAVPTLRQLVASRRHAKAFGLTRRELQIVRWVVDGYTNKEIADRSAISENTVKCHLTHIFNKLGASNRVELALFAAHHRLLDGI